MCSVNVGRSQRCKQVRARGEWRRKSRLLRDGQRPAPARLRDHFPTGKVHPNVLSATGIPIAICLSRTYTPTNGITAVPSVPIVDCLGDLRFCNPFNLFSSVIPIRLSGGMRKLCMIIPNYISADFNEGSVRTERLETVSPLPFVPFVSNYTTTQMFEQT